MLISSILKSQIRRIHFIGIGGIGMSGIARVLLSEGFLVTGSDIAANNETALLESLGAKVFIGHDKTYVSSADIVVYSSAISSDNEELIEAKRRKLPVIPRAMMLGEIMKLKSGLAVCGAHGKTTVTSLISYLLHCANIDPTVIIGGVVNQFGGNTLIGKGEFLVAEADESDGSFVHLSPSLAVITNIDQEHLDYYHGGISEITKKFEAFLNSMPFYGLVIACLDDNNVKNLLPTITKKVITYGVNSRAKYQARNIIFEGLTTKFDLFIDAKFVKPISTSLLGRHNVLNTLAAIAVLNEVTPNNLSVTNALKEFQGVKRRFSIVNNNANFSIIDDYAHHPTEIISVIQTAKEAFSHRKLTVIFQPHRFSRTKDLMKEFSSCFSGSDELILADIYSAAEKPIQGISSEILAQNILSSGFKNVTYAGCLSSCLENALKKAQPSGVYLTLGAGSIGTLGQKLNESLEKKYATSSS